VIEAETALVVVRRPELGGFKYVRSDIGQRIEFLRRESDRALHGPRDLVSRERLAVNSLMRGTGCPVAGSVSPEKSPFRSTLVGTIAACVLPSESRCPS